MGRAAVDVDVDPVGRRRHHVDLAAQRAEQPRGDHRGGAVGAVDQQPEAVHLLTERVEDPRGVLLGGASKRPGLSHVGAGRGVERDRHEGLDPVLLGVGQLEAVGAEQLDPVVGERVVGGREDGADVGAVLAHQHRDAGRRQDAGPQRDAAGRGDPGTEGVLEQRPRAARVPPDQHHRRAVGHPALAHVPDRGRPERQRELRAQGWAVRDTADAVGAEQAAGHRALSASRTAGAGGRP